MRQANMHEAKSQLSKLADLAANGETVVIAKAGKPYVDLVPHRENAAPRVPGALAGVIRIAGDFDQTPPGIIDDFEA